MFRFPLVYSLLDVRFFADHDVIRIRKSKYKYYVCWYYSPSLVLTGHPLPCALSQIYV